MRSRPHTSATAARCRRTSGWIPPPAGVLHLYGQPQDPAFFEAQEEFAARHPWFRVERVPAQTHFAMVETAKEAAAAIEAFVAAT